MLQTTSDFRHSTFNTHHPTLRPRRSDMPFNLVFFKTDHLGTPRVITDQDGKVLSTHDYLAYGEELTDPEFTTNNMKFTGHERDPETGLDYMLARYYTSGSGRFLQVDPGYDYDPMDPMSFNLYSYVRGNPVMGTDPTGMDIRMIYREPHLDAGHIIVQVVDHESGKVEATWSFGPQSTMAALSHLPVASHQTKDVNAYLSDKKSQSATLKTDKKTDAKTVKLINDRKKKNEQYDLDTNNCATTATEIVEGATETEVSNSMYPKKVFKDFQKATNPPPTAPTTPKPKEPGTTNPTPATPSQPVTTQDAPSSIKHRYQ